MQNIDITRTLLNMFFLRLYRNNFEDVCVTLFFIGVRCYICKTADQLRYTYTLHKFPMAPIKYKADYYNKQSLP